MYVHKLSIDFEKLESSPQLFLNVNIHCNNKKRWEERKRREIHHSNVNISIFSVISENTYKPVG